MELIKRCEFLILSSLLIQISKEVLEGLGDYAIQQCLIVLQDQLKRARMQFEEGRIGKEEYKKLESELAESIRNLRFNQTRAGRRQLDIKLV